MTDSTGIRIVELSPREAVVAFCDIPLVRDFLGLKSFEPAEAAISSRASEIEAAEREGRLFWDGSDFVDHETWQQYLERAKADIYGDEASKRQEALLRDLRRRLASGELIASAMPASDAFAERRDIPAESGGVISWRDPEGRIAFIGSQEVRNLRIRRSIPPEGLRPLVALYEFIPPELAATLREAETRPFTVAELVFIEGQASDQVDRMNAMVARDHQMLEVFGPSAGFRLRAFHDQAESYRDERLIFHPRRSAEEHFYSRLRAGSLVATAIKEGDPSMTRFAISPEAWAFNEHGHQRWDIDEWEPSRAYVNGGWVQHILIRLAIGLEAAEQAGGGASSPAVPVVAAATPPVRRGSEKGKHPANQSQARRPVIQQAMKIVEAGTAKSFAEAILSLVPAGNRNPSDVVKVYREQLLREHPEWHAEHVRRRYFGSD